MPICDSEKARYPKDWKSISLRIRERSGGRCECMGECGLHQTTGGPRRCEDGNLKAMCQRCHLRYDAAHHAKNSAATRRAKSPQRPLFEVPNANP